MTGRGFKGLVGVCVAGSLMVSSTAASAVAANAPIPRYSPWTLLSVMSSGAPSATICGAAVAAAAAAAQPSAGCVLPQVDAAPPVSVNPPPQPIPVPPVEPAGVGLGFSPLLLGLLALAAAVGIYFAVKKKSSNSPA